MNQSDLAKLNFATLLEYLQSEKWQFIEDSDQHYYRVRIEFTTTDFPLLHVLRIEPQKDAFIIESLLEFKVTFEDIGELGTALMLVNSKLQYGRFDFNVEAEKITFYYVHYYGDNKITYAQYAHLLAAISYTVDRYNDKFFLLTKGHIDLDELYDFIYDEN